MGDGFTEAEIAQLAQDDTPRSLPRVSVAVEPCPHCGSCDGWTYAITNTKRHRSIGLTVTYAKCRACDNRVVIIFRPLQRNTPSTAADSAA